MSLDDRRAALHGGHPDAEELAQFAEGGLPDVARRGIEAHLATCADCRDVAIDARQSVAELESGRVVMMKRRPWVWAAGALAAAAVLVVAITVGDLRLRPRDSDATLDALIAAADREPVRPLEARLTGFHHAPAPPATRGAEVNERSPELRIAVAQIQKAADSGDATEVALGVADAVIGRLDEAARLLEQAVQRDPKDAAAQSNLSAVYLARARQTGDSADVVRGLAAAERALAADSRLREACFNRALALDQLERVAEARTAWQQCLMLETDAGWAAEIRAHSAALQR